MDAANSYPGNVLRSSSAAGRGRKGGVRLTYVEPVTS